MLLGFISVIFFYNKVIPMQQCCFGYPKLKREIYISMLYLHLVTRTKILTVH